MHVISIIHEDDAGAGVFAEAAEQAGFDTVTWQPGSGPPPDLHEADALWTFGGSMHPDQDGDHAWMQEERDVLTHAIDHKMPILAVCLGAQLLAQAAGAKPSPAATPEIGWYDVELTEAGDEDPLLGALRPGFEAFEWHSYEIPLPDGAHELARSGGCLQAFRVDPFVWGIQFHAEVSRADALGWIETYGPGEAAVAAGVDLPAFRLDTAAKIDAWNELGRTMATRFLAISTLALRRSG